jgi:hypothetical protein
MKPIQALNLASSILAFALFAQAQAKDAIVQKPTGASQQKNEAQGKKPQLSKNECGLLGGAVVSTPVCTSGSGCSTTDAKGKGTISCLDKAE